MKVLLVTNMFPVETKPYYGIFVHEYVESMRQLGMEMDVFATDASRSRLNYVKDIPRLRKAVAQGTYDLIHLQHTYSVHQMLLGSIGLGKKSPSLLTLHEAEILLPSDVREKSFDPLGNLIYSRRAKLRALNAVDRVVSVEKTMPTVLGYQQPFEVIPPGIDTKLFVPKSKEECRRKLGFSLDRPLLFFPADPNRSVHKGFTILRQALQYLPPKTELKCGGSIRHEDMADYMNAADVVVQTSNFEASPMVIKEAMACNIPIVSTDVGDVRWILGETKGCYVCDREPRSVATSLQAALDFRARTSGRDRIDELQISLEGTAHKYLNIYQQMT